MDEGQHLQSAIPTGRAFGGPGRFAFDARSYLDETSPLCTPEIAQQIWAEWSPLWNTSKPVLLEKSPLTLVRSRLFAGLFPDSRFIFITRDPLTVALATRKMSNTSLGELLLHWCLAHAQMLRDLPHLGSAAIVVRYEDLVRDPAALKPILGFLGLDDAHSLPTLIDHNTRYEISEEELASIPRRAVTQAFGGVLSALGYDLNLAGR